MTLQEETGAKTQIIKIKQMKTLLNFALVALLFIGVSSCKDKDDPSLGDPPSQADAAFTFKASSANDNIIEFTASNPDLTAKWDLGNGQTAEGTMVEGTYPLAGTYTVTLTVFNSGGSASSSQDVVIANDDPGLLNDPLITMLTGGVSGPGQRNWVIDSTRFEHLGVGPHPTNADFDGYYPKWWQATALAKTTSGLYNDMYVFKLAGFGFDHKTGGRVFVKTGHQSEFPGAFANADDYSAPFSDQLDETWNLVKGDEDTTIVISGNAFIGLYTGVREYTLMELTDSVMRIRYIDTKDPNTMWYVRLVPDYVPVDGGSSTTDPTTTASDPTAAASDVISLFSNVYTDVAVNSWKTDWSASDFEEIQIGSNDVKKYTNLGFVGIETVAENSIDASGMTHIEFDVYTPNATEIKFKLVDFGADNAYQGGDDSEFELTLSTPNQNEWVHYKVPLSDFTGLAARANLSQYIFVGTPYQQTTMYLDNVYFSK